ncbi:MAG TPA: chemotaxis protein CheW [Pirellulaceae bacterium]|nr:chemotaxis protein CheW [Pirellulaceae bacterium]
MLGLLVEAAGQRLAVDVRDVAQVLPLATLRPYSPAPASLVGLLLHHGGVMPVFDLERIRGGEPPPERLHTRLILVQARQAADQPQFALRVARVIEVRPFDDASFASGKILLDAEGTIEVIDPAVALPDDARHWLRRFSAAEVGG